MNFNLSCGQVLQKYDRERDQERAEFDLQRDEVLRKIIAAGLGVKLTDGPSKQQTSQANEHKRTMTRQDIMRSYVK